MVSIIERIVEGFKIWRKGWLSFILAVILLSFAFTVFLIPAMFGVTTIAGYFESGSIVSVAIIAFAITVLTIAFSFVVIGTICGLGKELIEIEDTRAENTLHYIKSYGLKFAAIGLIITTIVLGPFIVVGIIFNFINILPIISSDLVAGIAFVIIIFIVAFFLFAPFTLAIPACLIEDDVGPSVSIKNSFHAFRKDPKTISGLLASFIIIFVALLILPIIGLIGITEATSLLLLVSILGVFTAIGFFVSLFIVLPVMCVTFTKLYYDYKIPEKEEVSEEESPISLF
ncbi:MAG: hypothetical protein ACFFCD_00215 [Promethearchaeota archaeon]